jgi:hypothetical protein
MEERYSPVVRTILDQLGERLYHNPESAIHASDPFRSILRGLIHMHPRDASVIQGDRS